MGRTDAEAEAEAPIRWPPDARADSSEKILMLGKSEGRRRRRQQRTRWLLWHHEFNGHEFEQAPGDGEEKGSHVCCSLWDHKESDRTEQLNNNIDIDNTLVVTSEETERMRGKREED